MQILCTRFIAYRIQTTGRHYGKKFNLLLTQTTPTAMVYYPLLNIRFICLGG